MSDADWSAPPRESAGDMIHRIVRVSLGVAAAPAGEIFAFLIKSPFERRMAAWMERCEMRFQHLVARDNDIVARLSSTEQFASVFIAATQSAVRTHQEEKLRRLVAAVENSANGIDVAEDVQLMFVRFVDELTPSHFALLDALADHEMAAAGFWSYDALRDLFITVTHRQAEPMEFKLLCKDLEARVLVRFSDALEDFGGIAVTNAIATEDSGLGTRLAVTAVGHAFRRFVAESVD